MGVNERKDRRGRKKVYVDKRWPDGVQFRRVVQNRTVGKKLLARIEESIVMGTWRALRDELNRPDEDVPQTIRELAPLYLAHCRTRNRRPDFKEQALSSIVKILGPTSLVDFRRSHAQKFIERRLSEVKASTVNRGLAVIKNMFTFALDQGYVTSHPLIRFPLLPETERALRVMSLEEERRLVKSVAERDSNLGAYVALLGETGLRKSEGLRLIWPDIDRENRILAVGQTKSGKARYVPLTEYAMKWLLSVPRVVGVSQVFTKPNRQPWKDPRESFNTAKKAAKLNWVSLHDLRHFRATQWVRNGIDLRTVQGLLGHASIQTTMRYAHFAPKHAARSVHEVEKIEATIMLQREESGTTG